jgi:DNA-directed RNA polymerase specialized sigma24 family protein
MNREQIINEFVKDKEYRAICRQVAGNDADDLYQELVLFVLGIPDDKLTRLNESCLKCFFYRMAQRQYCSRNSSFYRKYKREREWLRDTDHYVIADTPAEVDDTMARVDKIVQELEAGPAWYDIGILKLYAEKDSQREVSEVTGIPFRSVSNAVTSARHLRPKQMRKHE